MVCAVLAAAMGFGLSAQQAPRATLFEGARLLTGEPAPPIENSAMLVENGRITRVGRRGDIPPPQGAARVNLTGKTVMPALVDTHNHLGWTDHKTGIATPTTFNREIVIDHLRRYAYFGFAAANSLGLDRWNVDPNMPYTLRSEVIPNAARFLTAGRGIAAAPTAGPLQEYRVGVPYGAETEAEGRARVQAMKARDVEMIKIWVDSRQGTVPKLEVRVYEAIIDEAHKNGMRVVAHIFNLEDAKQLLTSGIDGFAHTVRDRDVDDEYLALVKQHPKVWTGPNLPVRALSIQDTSAQIDWIADTVPPSQVTAMRAALAARQKAAAPTKAEADAAALFAVQCRNLRKVHDAGMVLGLGTDGNADIGWGGHAELADMVFCGLSPAEAIVAGTKTSAELLKLNDLGTIAPGKSADFIVRDANPLDNILNTRKINAVYLRGSTVDRQALSRGFRTEAR